jgi:hypothetical protein
MPSEIYLYDRENGDTESQPVGVQNPFPVAIVPPSAPVPGGGYRLLEVTGGTQSGIYVPASYLVGSAGAQLLPNAAALSDTLANPTTSQVGANMLLWNNNASQWQRAPVGINGATSGMAIGAQGLQTVPLLYNRNASGGSFDPQLNNIQGTALALQAGSVATRTSADIPTSNLRSLTLVVVTANKANTPTFTPVVKMKDAGGTNYETLWTAAAAIAANGTLVYQFGPGLGTAPSGVTESKQVAIPKTLQIVLTYAGNGTTDAFDTTAFYELGV